MLGAQHAAPVDVDAALELLRAYGVFEPPAGSSTLAWSPASEIEPAGTRLRNVLIGVWVATLLAGVGGYFGWNAWIEQRHQRAAQWVSQASALLEAGDHAALVDAERLLRMARDRHPASKTVPNEVLQLHAQRVLDDGQRDLSALRAAMARARAAGVSGGPLLTATAIVSAFSGRSDLRDQDLARALGAAQGDGRLLYVVGRLEQQLALPSASEHLQAASQLDPKLAPAKLALGELDLEAGDRTQAQARIEAVLSAYPKHLRAQLLRLFVSADTVQPTQAQQALDTLAKDVSLAGPADQVVLALTRARLLRRQGQLEPASKAVEQAASAGADEPRLLAWVAREALSVGKSALAQRAASQAVSAAPEVASYRRLLASILIERGDGEHALVLLDKTPSDDIAGLVMKAQAALLTGDDAALRTGLGALKQIDAAKAEHNVQIGALSVRIESKLNPDAALVERAKQLTRAAPGDPEALLALAEAALSVHEAATANTALAQRFAVAPNDPNAHYLQAKARRMLADAAGAEASFRKALELAPGQVDSLLGLGGLLLDIGKYAEADAVYQELCSRAGSLLSGRLGRVEALLGLGRVDDAQVQLDGVVEAERSSMAYRMLAARVALAHKKPGEALTLLRPLVDATVKKAPVMVLYGDALFAAEQIDPSAGAYDAAIALDAELPEALIGRAETYLRAEKPADAFDLLQTAQKGLPKRLRPPEMRARLLGVLGHAYIMRSRRGDLESARALLREAGAIANAPAEVFFWLGESLGGKITPEARTAYHRYLELEPSGKYADRATRALGALL